MVSCASSGSRVRQLEEMNLRVAELQRSVNALASRVETVENRLLLAQDEIETLKLSGLQSAPSNLRVPNLPTVSLRPGQTPHEGPSGDVTGPTSPQQHPSQTAEDEDLTVTRFEEQPFASIDDEGRVVKSGHSRERALGSSGPREENPARRRLVSRSKKGKYDKQAEAVSEYRDAMEVYRQGRVREARQAFLVFAQRYPRHPYADNAMYWAAECLYDQREYDRARAEFAAILDRYPKGNKVPDAMVKIALCMKMTGQRGEARNMLEAVVLTYPGTSAAATAQKLLENFP